MQALPSCCKTGSMHRLPILTKLLCDSGPVVYAYRLMSSGSVYCRRCGVKKLRKYRNFNQIFTFRGSCAHPLYRYKPNSARDTRPMVYAYMRNFIGIHSLCHPPVMKNCNLGQFFKFGGLLYPAPSTDDGQIWYATVHHKSVIMCKNSSPSVILTHSSGKKPQILPFL